MHQLESKPSRWLALALLSVTLLALLALSLAALPGLVRFGLALGVVATALRGWRQDRMAEPLRLTPQGELQCADVEGAWQTVEVLGDSFVSPHWVVLRYRAPDRRVRTRVFVEDSLDADSLRRLRVSLRWARHRRSDTASRGAD